MGSIVVREIEVTDADRLRSSRNLEVKCDDRAAGQVRARKRVATVCLG